MSQNNGHNLKLNTYKKAVLGLTAYSLFGKELIINKDVDLNAVYEECKVQCVEGLCYNSVKPYLTPELNKKWGRQYRELIAANIRIEAEHSDVDRIMTSSEIPYVTMKGASSAIYYPNSEFRTMGDVDFLVKKDDLSKAQSALLNYGFKVKKSEASKCHIAFEKDVSIWEMHWEPNGIPNNVKGEIIRALMEDIIDTAEVYSYGGNHFLVPDKFHHGLILLLHTATHLVNTGVGIRHICDWAVFVSSMNNDEFINMFEETLKITGMWRFAQLLTLVSVKYLGCPQREWAGKEDDEILEKIILDVFDGGNFGIKNEQRINQAKLMTDRNSGNVSDDNSVKQLFRSLNYKTKLSLPLFEKHKFLLPVGWIIIVVRHLVKIIQGKRPSIKPTDVISGAKQRQKIYSNFNLFE